MTKEQLNLLQRLGESMHESVLPGSIFSFDFINTKARSLFHNEDDYFCEESELSDEELEFQASQKDKIFQKNNPPQHCYTVGCKIHLLPLLTDEVGYSSNGIYVKNPDDEESGYTIDSITKKVFGLSKPESQVLFIPCNVENDYDEIIVAGETFESLDGDSTEEEVNDQILRFVKAKRREKGWT